MTELATIQPDTPITRFMLEVVKAEGYNAFKITCSPSDLPSFINELELKDARVMITTLGSKDISWTTKGLKEMYLTNNHQPPKDTSNQELSSCVPVALKNLGFHISTHQIKSTSNDYNGMVHPEQKYHGHVMAVKPNDVKFDVSDQFGSCTISPEIVIKMAEYRTKIAGVQYDNIGYYFVK